LLILFYASLLAWLEGDIFALTRNELNFFIPFSFFVKDFKKKPQQTPNLSRNT